MYLPLLTVAGLSFNASRFSSTWKGWTWHWYQAALSGDQARSAVGNTLILAVSSTAISTLLGTLLGYGLNRHSFRGKEQFSKLLMLPIAAPDIVMAVSLLLFFTLTRQTLGWFQLGMAAMIASHATFQIPFVAVVVRSRLQGFDPAIEEAAYDLGASRWQRLRHITLPLLRPGMVAGALLAFTLSLDDFVISFFTSGAGSTTLPIYIYSSVKRGVTGEINALSTLMIAAAALGTIAITWARGGKAPAGANATDQGGGSKPPGQS
jgi:spermidine/putrescine transport system permease protein